MDSKYLLAVLVLTVVTSGCIADTSKRVEGPAWISEAEVTLEAEIQDISLSNKTGSNPTNKDSTISPDDSATLKIQSIDSVDVLKDDQETNLEEGDVIEVDLRRGARPAKIVKLPGKDYPDEGNGTTVSVTKEWSEWEEDGFVFKQKTSAYDEKEIVETLPGLEEGERIRAEVVVQSDNEFRVGSYEVLN